MPTSSYHIAQANKRSAEYRSKRAGLAADAKQAGSLEGRAMIADAVDVMEPWLAGDDIVHLLYRVPGFADTRVAATLKQLGVRERRPVGALSLRQRALLAELIRTVGLPGGLRAGEPAPRDVPDRMAVAA